MNRGSSVMVLGSSWVAASFLGGLVARSTAPDRATASVPAPAAVAVAPAGAKAEPGIPRLIEAREFRLVDGDGQPRARLEVDRGTARLVFNGSERDSCSATIGASDTAATVSLYGSGSELTLGMTPGVSAVVELKGLDTVKLAAPARSQAGLKVIDKAGRSTAFPPG